MSVLSGKTALLYMPAGLGDPYQGRKTAALADVIYRMRDGKIEMEC